MYTTISDQKHEWKILVGATLLMLLLWGLSTIPTTLAQTRAMPDVGDAINVFVETYNLTDQDRRELTDAVADWLTRDPSLGDQPLYVYQLMKHYQNVQ